MEISLMIAFIVGAVVLMTLGVIAYTCMWCKLQRECIPLNQPELVKMVTKSNMMKT
jgi:hypothetical protein